MAKSKKKKIEEAIVEEAVIIEETNLIEEDAVVEEEIVENVEKENIENYNINEVIIEPENILTEEKAETLEEEKTLCEILLATPTYFVVSKNGVSITINEKNNYKRGDEVIL